MHCAHANPEPPAHSSPEVFNFSELQRADFFPLTDCAFVVGSKVFTVPKVICSITWDFYSLMVYSEVCDPFRGNFCEGCQYVCRFICLPVFAQLVVPTRFVDKTRLRGLFLGFLVRPIELLLFLSPRPLSLDYCSFIGNIDVLNLLLLLKY